MTAISRNIVERRSTRRFSDRPVAQSDIDGILEAARLAPSSKNGQPWRIVLMEQPMIAEYARAAEECLREETGGGHREADIVGATATMRILERAPVCAFVLHPEDVRDCPIGSRKGVDVQAIGALLENMALEAAERGVGSLWACDVLYAYETTMRFLGCDGTLMAAMVFGYPDRIEHRAGRKPIGEIVTVRR